MRKTTLTYVENVIVIVAIAVSVHYFGGLHWPWAIFVGAAVSVPLRWFLRGVVAPRARKPPLTGGG